MTGDSHQKRMRRVLLASFGGIAAIVALGNVVGSWHARRARIETGEALANAFRSVDLVSEIGRNLARERLLIDTHIAEKEKLGMERAAAHVAEVDRALYAAVSLYQPLVTDEAVVWRRVESDLSALRPRIAEVLALSSQNRDVEAQQRLAAVDTVFGRVNGDLARLVDINRAAALGVLARADGRQRTANRLSAALALVAIVLTLGVGGMATRLVAHREEQMVRYSEQLEMQNRELDAFAGRVAHDLRGPLTTMGMALTRLMQECAEDAGVGAIMQRSLLRMERLIQDLLALSQIETQLLGAHCDPAAAATLVREEQAARLQEAGATLHLDVAPARVRSSEGLLIQVLANLVDNAIKYARPEAAPAIEVAGRVRDGAYELSIGDNGMGMSPEEVRQAFTPFYRALRAPKAPGTGLGLSIVKRVAEASGGSVRLHSTLGSGSTFVLRFPLDHGRGDGA